MRFRAWASRLSPFGGHTARQGLRAPCASQPSAVLPSQGAGLKDSAAGPALNKVTTAMLMGMESEPFGWHRGAAGPSRRSGPVPAAETCARPLRVPPKPLPGLRPSAKGSLTPPRSHTPVLPGQRKEDQLGGQLSPATVPRAARGSLLALAAAPVVPDTKCEELLELLAQDRRPVS